LSGTGSLGDYLSDKIKINLKLSRVRADTLGYPQRSFLGSTSEVDQKEAYNIGRFAVKSSNAVNFSFSAGMKERINLNKKYKIEFKINALTDVAGKTKIMTKEFYDLKASNISKKFFDYAYPLIGKKIIDTKSLI
jgi:6-phosphofructokinase 1